MPYKIIASGPDLAHNGKQYEVIQTEPGTSIHEVGPVITGWTVAQLMNTYLINRKGPVQPIIKGWYGQDGDKLTKALWILRPCLGITDPVFGEYCP